MSVTYISPDALFKSIRAANPTASYRKVVKLARKELAKQHPRLSDEARVQGDEQFLNELLVCANREEVRKVLKGHCRRTGDKLDKADIEGFLDLWDEFMKPTPPMLRRRASTSSGLAKTGNMIAPLR
jgi:hypothetical protein